MTDAARVIRVNDVDLAWWSTGEGPPLLLVHGFTGSADDWLDVVDDLATDRRVVTYDHRGHGDSTNTGDPATYTLDQLADDLTAFVAALDLPPVDLLGHSMGGIVAMRYTLRHPERVRSFVPMDTGARATGTEESKAFMRAGMHTAEEHGLMAVYDAIAPFVGEGELADRSRERMRRGFERMDVVAFTTLGEELITHESMLDRLATLDLPVTVLVGESDHGLRGAADELAATIPGATHVVIPDAAHSPQLENRSAWLEAVQAHLARVEGR